MAAPNLDVIVNLCKRRGFVFPSSEIYGGFRSTYDYGPLGVLLKQNVKAQWWRSMVQLRDDVVGLDASILMAPRVWEASGHIEGFTDPLVECKNCHERFRADKIDTSAACPNCGVKDSFTEARHFNLMFKTYVGPTEEDASVAFFRPETAQGIFVNFQNVQTASRKKLPFGIAQMGKSFRNEITPGNFLFRTREFEQMEMEYFCSPEEGEKWLEYWRNKRMEWYIDLGIAASKLRLREHEPDELSHYSKGTYDIEYEFPWDFGELEGIAYRTDFDLKQHAEFSGKDLTYFDQENDRKFIPHVVEPAAGVDRTLLTFLIDAYDEEEVRGEKRTVLRLDSRLAPVKIAVLPLSKHENLSPEAHKLADSLRGLWQIDYDEAGSIGRRYRRQDELGTPYCVTFDFDSLEDQAVTVRDRDSMEQERISIEKLSDYLAEKL